MFPQKGADISYVRREWCVKFHFSSGSGMDETEARSM